METLFYDPAQYFTTDMTIIELWSDEKAVMVTIRFYNVCGPCYLVKHTVRMAYQNPGVLMPNDV